MRGLMNGLVPFATDTNGACSLFLDVPALVIPQDSNGSASTMRRMMHGDDYEISINALNMVDTVYVLGNEDTFQDCMQDLDERTGQDFVVLVHGPVSCLLGMDLRHRAALLEERVGKPVYLIETTGNEYYDKGLEKAFAFAYETFTAPVAEVDAGAAQGTAQDGLNLLGLNHIDYEPEVRAAVVAAAEKSGSLLSVWGSRDGQAQWQQAAAARRNVVCSASALKLARRFKKDFGCEFVCLDELDWLDGWADGLQLEGAPRVLVIGEQVKSNLLRRLLKRMGADSVQVASFFAMDRAIKQPADIKLRDEQEFKQLVGDPQAFDLIIGDASLARFCASPCFTLTHLPARYGRREKAGLGRDWFERLAQAWNEYACSAH